MINSKEKNKLSTNQLVVYQIFKENPYCDFNVKSIMELINKKDKKISQRTVYRVIKRLMDIGKIYCSNIQNGMRSFELVEKNYYMIICEKCGVKRIANIDNKYRDRLYKDHQQYTITGGSIRFYGICQKCIKEDNLIIDNYSQLVYNNRVNDNQNQITLLTK